MPAWLSPKDFENLVRDRLGALFLDAVCVDSVNWLRVRIHQSRQKLIYVSNGNANRFAVIDIGQKQLSNDELLKQIVSTFCAFNEQWENRTE